MGGWMDTFTNANNLIDFWTKVVVFMFFYCNRYSLLYIYIYIYMYVYLA